MVMTATDELRAMLDERGVEWSSIGGDTAWEDSRGWTAVGCGFPARIKAVRHDGVSLWYLPSDEVEHERDKAKYREERLTKLIHDMYETLRREDKPHRLYGLHEQLEKYELRMEALGIEVDE